MKTINEGAKEYVYYSETESYLESFKAGAEFAQRWIPVEEELPDNSMTTSQLAHYKHTDKVIYKTSNGKYGITCRSKFLGSDWKWNGSGTLQGSITHWRPIELK